MATGVVDSSHASAPQTAEVRADITGDASSAEGKTFADFGVSEAITSALDAHGITAPFPIQALTLPVALKGRDIIGQAKTGTGKTLGFAIPMIEKVVGPGEDGWEDLSTRDQGAPQGLVVLPTRELAQQVATEMRRAAANRTIRIADIYGGRAYEPQEDALRRGVEIIVGTPGRILDFIGSHKLRLDQAHTVVLDEADEMLDLGFLPDVEKLLSYAPARRQTMLFSATMPGAVINMARRHMSKPTHIRVQDPNDDGATVKNTLQVVYRCHPMNKTEVVARILQARGRGRTIIFTRTKRTAARVEEELVERGFAAGALHGNLGQSQRERALRAFRDGKIDVLVATDVAARGIDVDDVTHVINYQMPEDERHYIHRIGRTGRAGHSGTAVTFVDWEDLPRWGLINQALNLGIPDPPETYHTSDHLYADLNIPHDVTGRLSRSGHTSSRTTQARETPRSSVQRGGSRHQRRRLASPDEDSRGTSRRRVRTGADGPARNTSSHRHDASANQREVASRRRSRSTAQSEQHVRRRRVLTNTAPVETRYGRSASTPERKEAVTTRVTSQTVSRPSRARSASAPTRSPRTTAPSRTEATHTASSHDAHTRGTNTRSVSRGHDRTRNTAVRTSRTASRRAPEKRTQTSKHQERTGTRTAHAARTQSSTRTGRKSVRREPVARKVGRSNQSGTRRGSRGRVIGQVRK